MIDRHIRMQRARTGEQIRTGEHPGQRAIIADGRARGCSATPRTQCQTALRGVLITLTCNAGRMGNNGLRPPTAPSTCRAASRGPQGCLSHLICRRKRPLLQCVLVQLERRLNLPNETMKRGATPGTGTQGRACSALLVHRLIPASGCAQDKCMPVMGGRRGWRGG